MAKRIIFLAVILILSAGIIFLGGFCFLNQKKISVLQKSLISCNFNKKLADFQKLFINKILEKQGEISYEERLDLEVAVTDTKDAEVIAQWHKFLDSKTEAEAQENVKELLKLFANKIIY